MIAENLIPLAGLAAVLILIFALLRWRAKRRPRWVVVDGSNVMHWDGGTPSVAPIKAVLAELTKRGMTPGVVFDANAGYLLTGKYRHDHALGRMIGLPEERVMVVPKGTVADTYILAAARDLGAKIVTNDRYRDWAEPHPEVLEPGFLIRGGVRDGVVWVE